METNQQAISISDEELRSINQAISTRYGVDFSEYEISSLKRRIIRIIHKFSLDGVFGLWQRLLTDPEFIHQFRDEISVGLTEMFRNPDLWMYMRDEILKEKKSINIWHAGISTGEEVYSMVITLEELGILSSSTLWATDLSSKFIGIAQSGQIEFDQFSKYKNNYNTFNPNGNFNQYFSIEPNSIFLNKSLLRNVKFEQHNVLTSVYEQKFDLILCRNVMIYFNDELKLKTLEKFSRYLSPEGFLIIGYFDSMPDNFNRHFQYQSHAYKIFKKNVS